MSLKRALFVLVALCFTTAVTAVSTAAEINSPVGAKHVVMIGYDGYGAHYIKWDEVPTLKKLRDGGAWTQKMRCVLPSVSAINWATMLMGAGSELHGYRTWGSQKPDLPSRVLTDKKLFPCIFHAIKSQYPDSTAYAAYSWGGIGFLFDKTAAVETCEAGKRPDSVYNYNGKGEKTDKNGKKYTVMYPNDELVCEKGLEFLAKNPTFTFLYFAEPDGVGHTIGWGTQQYYDTVKKLDIFLARLINYLEKNDRFKDTVVIFVSDHGGTEKGHGGEIMEHMEVPFLAYGCGVKKGEITDVVVNYDVAATIAWILGAKRPQVWRGVPVTSAFQTK